MRHGGSRPGAGRKPGKAKPKAIVAAAKAVVTSSPQSRRFATALDYLMDVVNDVEADEKSRLTAAQIAVPYTNSKLAEAAPGKKGAQKEAAEKAGAGKFAAPTGPRLAVNNS